MFKGEEKSIVFRRVITSVRWCFAIFVSAAFLLTALTSQAQDLPRGTITIVVPFAAGAVSDALARLVAPKLAELLDRNVIVENKAGANTILGTTAVARSQPDGRTLLLGGTAFVVNTALYKGKLTYDPVKDFEPVSLIATSKSVLVAHNGLGIARLSQLLELAKSRPGEITYASAGSGNMTHLGMEVFRAHAGIELQHVPYRGANPALTDVLAGHVPLMFINPGAVEEYVKNGRLIGIAVTGEKRLEGFPDVPTFVE